MTEFNEGWWNCFNSFANNSCYDNEKACIEVLRGAGVTKDEMEEVLLIGELNGAAYDIVEEFLESK